MPITSYEHDAYAEQAAAWEQKAQQLESILRQRDADCAKAHSQEHVCHFVLDSAADGKLSLPVGVMSVGTLSASGTATVCFVYNQRWQVESVFSRMKRRLGYALRVRTDECRGGRLEEGRSSLVARVTGHGRRVTLFTSIESNQRSQHVSIGGYILQDLAC